MEVTIHYFNSSNNYYCYFILVEYDLRSLCCVRLCLILLNRKKNRKKNHRQSFLMSSKISECGSVKTEHDSVEFEMLNRVSHQSDHPVYYYYIYMRMQYIL